MDVCPQKGTIGGCEIKKGAFRISDAIVSIISRVFSAVHIHKAMMHLQH